VLGAASHRTTCSRSSAAKLTSGLILPMRTHISYWPQYVYLFMIHTTRNFASRDSLNVRLRCGLILCSCHKRFTVFLLTPCAFAISRQLQWVMPLGLLCKVA